MARCAIASAEAEDLGPLKRALTGEFDLDAPVNDYLEDSRVQDLEETPVTFRHILSHTSGLNPGARTVPVWRRELPVTLDALARSLKSVRPPELRYEYNNNAFGLAGLLVEKLSGQTYEDYVVEHILRPLGVETPGPVHPTPEMVERLALPYRNDGGRPRPVAQVRYDVFPAGDIYLTASDMARFLGAHLNGGTFQGQRILSEESTAETHRRQGVSYGLGWSVPDVSPHLIQHGGGVPGFATYMIGDTKAKVGAYVMSNSGNMSTIGRMAVSMLGGNRFERPRPRTAVELAPDLLEEYLGQFELRADFVMKIFQDGGRMYVQATGQGRIEMFASKEDHFFLRSPQAEIHFLRDEQGKVDRLILDQGGEVTARRIE